MTIPMIASFDNLILVRGAHGCPGRTGQVPRDDLRSAMCMGWKGEIFGECNEAVLALY